MNDGAGLWIDHRKAVIVTLSGDKVQTAVVVSGVEKHPERGGDSPMKGRYEAHSVPADDRRQRALTAELDVYYDAVIAALGGSATVLVFGPGEAKEELRNRLAKIKGAGFVTTVEAADKMTDRQIIAKVREHFGHGAVRARPRHSGG
jgi:hypothetical protein